MMMPTIHLNGTSKSGLQEPLEQAIRQLQVAIDKVHETYPNGRDYYPQGDGAISQAMKEHADRIALLKSVHDELSAIYFAIDEAY